jgi:hypothetical protein
MIKEKANTYVEEKVIDILKEAFAKVYADGYRDGYKDREEEIPVDLRDNTTEYVDLGLPSGTLWAVDYEKERGKVLYAPFDKAEKSGIPSVEQWKELMNCCKWEYTLCGASLEYIKEALCVGPNGNVLKFIPMGKINTNSPIDQQSVFFWIKGELSEAGDNDRHCALIKRSPIVRGFYDNSKYIGKEFSGYKLPIRLVQQKVMH